MSERAIDLASSSSKPICELLARHPRVDKIHEGDCEGIRFSLGEWSREVHIGDADAALYGLTEIIDNNPMVCADFASVPGAAASLALIALAPLCEAGLLVDSPVVMLSFADGDSEIDTALKRVGWTQGATIHVEPMDLGTVRAATVMASIQTPDDLDDIDALYEERFGRSFYVQRDETSEWTPQLVAGRPNATYRLRISPDSPHSLLTIRVMADAEGKCGAAQAVHAMNVMCGYEESLGID